MLKEDAADEDFNPRSRVGSDMASQLYKEDDNDFNPRSRVGSDYSQAPARAEYKISIHAPA